MTEQTEQQRLHALWTEERAKLAAARFEFEQERRRNGDGFLEAPPLPTTPPEWWLTLQRPDGRVTEVAGEVRGRPKQHHEDGTFTIELPSLTGRPPRAPREDTAEEALRKQARAARRQELRQRAKRALGVDLP